MYSKFNEKKIRITWKGGLQGLDKFSEFDMRGLWWVTWQWRLLQGL